MKSANCISTTGRRPIIAAPMAAPTKPDSANGVSKTRHSPYFWRNHSVIFKAAPLHIFRKNPFDNLKPPAIGADIFAHQKDPLVASHLFVQSLRDCFQVRHLASGLSHSGHIVLLPSCGFTANNCPL